MSFLLESGFLEESSYRCKQLKMYLYQKNEMDCPEKKSNEQCKLHLRSVRDTMELLQGKWKVFIISSLVMDGKQRFMDLQRNIEGIGAKMLSTELQELEMNQLVKRTVYETKPITVEYEITEYGKTLKPVITEISIWGQKHRERLFTNSK